MYKLNEGSKTEHVAVKKIRYGTFPTFANSSLKTSELSVILLLTFSL